MSQRYQSQLRRCAGALGLALLASSLTIFPIEAGASEDRLQQLRSYYRALRQQTWQLYESANMLPRDIRGLTIADDLRAHGLTREKARSLDEQLAAAESGAGQDGEALVDATAMAVTTQLLGEVGRFTEIANYWTGSGVAVRARDNWTSFLKINGLPEAQDLDPAIPVLEKRLLEELQAGDFRAAGRVSAPELAALYGKARMTLTRQVAGSRSGAAPVRDFRNRSAPCTTPSPPPPGGPAYPPTSRRLSQEGTVVLRLRLSPEGCTVAAAVVISSGYTALDDAAVDWALQKPADPGEARGPAVERTKDLAVSFKFEDE